MIVGGSAQFVDRARKAPLEPVGEAATPEDLYPLVEQLAPDAVLVEAVNRDWLEAAGVLAGIRKNVVFFVAGAFGMDEWRRIRRAGCVVVAADPGQAAREVLAAVAGRGPVFVYEDRPAPALFAARKVDVVRNRILGAVFGIKGGIGKTEIALNLAAYYGAWAKSLMKGQGQRFAVCLLDFNSDYGTSKVNLGLYSRALDPNAPMVRTVADWEGLAPDAPWEEVYPLLNYNAKANLYFLAPPANPDQRLAFDGPAAGRILTLAKRHFDVVVVDLGTALDKRDQAIIALDMADRLLFVVEPYHTVVATNAEFIRTEMRAIMDTSRVSMVINHAHAPSRAKKVYSPSEVVRSLGLPFLAAVPHEPGIVEDVPHVLVQPRSPFSLAVRGIARSLIGSSAVDIAPRGNGLFGFRKERRR